MIEEQRPVEVCARTFFVNIDVDHKLKSLNQKLAPKLETACLAHTAGYVIQTLTQVTHRKGLALKLALIIDMFHNDIMLYMLYI